jgi:hypothetical protein
MPTENEEVTITAQASSGYDRIYATVQLLQAKTYRNVPPVTANGITANGVTLTSITGGSFNPVIEV